MKWILLLSGLMKREEFPLRYGIYWNCFNVTDFLLGFSKTSKAIQERVISVLTKIDFDSLFFSFWRILIRIFDLKITKVLCYWANFLVCGIYWLEGEGGSIYCTEICRPITYCIIISRLWVSLGNRLVIVIDTRRHSMTDQTTTNIQSLDRDNSFAEISATKTLIFQSSRKSQESRWLFVLLLGLVWII